MCFSSTHKIDDFSLITNLYPCEDGKSVMEAAKQINIFEVSPVCQELEDKKNENFIEVIQFKRTSNNIQVLCLVQIDRRNNTFELKLCEGRFAKYFYLLAINSNSLATLKKIDIFNIIPYASLIQIREGGI